jgi:hypothetical protein
MIRLDITKNEDPETFEDTDTISILAYADGDKDRVIDIMYFLKQKCQGEDTLTDTIHVFSVDEVEIIRDFLTTTLNVHYRLTKS